eukprot:7455062-Pyramimonas_sp.AAC.1
MGPPVLRRPPGTCRDRPEHVMIRDEELGYSLTTAGNSRALQLAPDGPKGTIHSRTKLGRRYWEGR